MPGGNPTISLIRPNLQSFLARKRKSPEQWLLDNGIITQTTLEAFLKAETWQVSPELANQFSELLKPLCVPAIIIPQPPPEPVVVQAPVPEVVAVEPVAVIEPVVVVEPEPVVVEEQRVEVIPVVSVVVEEPVLSASNAVVVTTEEGSGVTAFKADYSFKDRKKSR